MTNYTGQTFDRYQLLESLGGGGMAEVYKATRIRLKGNVAVKIISIEKFPPAVIPNVLKRFEHEAEILAQLTHTNIVSIIDYGEYEGVPYLVMEYLPGGTLKDRLQGEPLPWQDSIRLLLPIARALQFSHDSGIIHRDVKPSNILITLSGEPMLSDFGIAKILESEGNTALTSTGMSIGTPEYMAPEQWIGNTSAQSDLYSLGVVLYEMVTGRLPYKAETPPALFLKQSTEPLPNPKQFATDLPDRVEEVIIKALAKKPDDRYQGMGEFIAAMDALLIGDTVLKQPVTSSVDQKEEESLETNLISSTVQGQIGNLPTLNARIPVEGKPRKTELQATRLAKAQSAIPEIPFANTSLQDRIKVRPLWIIVIVVIAAVISFVVWGARPLAARLASTSTPSPTETRLPTSTLLPSLTPTITLTSVPTVFGGGIGKIAFTSTMDGVYDIFVMDPDGSNLKRLTHTSTASQPSWSPDGKHIAFSSGPNWKWDIYLMNSDGSNVIRLTTTSGLNGNPIWAPDSKRIAFVSDPTGNGKSGIYSMNMDGSNIIQLTKDIPVAYQPNSWSPDGKHIAFISGEVGHDAIYIMNSDGSNPVPLTSGAVDAHPSWSPDGKHIAFSSTRDGNTQIYVMNSDGSNILQLTNTGKFSNGSPSWSPDGKHIVFLSERGENVGGNGKAEIYVMDSDGSNPIQLTNNGSYNYDPTWSS